MMGETKKTKELFLLCMSGVYLVAFSSLFIQIPGLYGDNGILPVKNVLQPEAESLSDLISSQQLTLLRLLPKLGVVGAEVGMNVLCFLGILVSFLSLALPSFRNCFTFFVLWAFYMSLFQVGQTFLWFQWDTLLLEAGFLTVITAPAGFSRLRSKWFHQHDRLTFWLIRWLTFRLMFCSGVVKLLSQCPTWWGLTALTVHYESQCIPTPLAWYAHQLPVWFHKFSVASVFVIQIITSILFFSPVRSQRVISFYAQAFLMFLIIFTGNYNFFNWFSIALCLPLVNDYWIASWTRHQSVDDKGSKNGIINRVCWVARLATNVIVYASIIYIAHTYFSMRLDILHFKIDSAIAFNLEDLQTFLRTFVPITIWIAALSLAYEIFVGILRSIYLEDGALRKATNVSSCIIFGLITSSLFCVSLVPYTDIEPTTQKSLPAAFSNWYRSTQNYQVAHAYGLFRSMTGVGGRPEVIVEGSNKIEGPWEELNFLYKPGDVSRRPPIVAPHQPRLDWQMWFAALGSYDYNAWFLNLVYRLLTNQREVMELMDKGPFDDEPPVFIRAHLYHYHYTAWNDTTHRSWWKRDYVREYLPVVSLTDPGLIDYLRRAKIYREPSDPIVVEKTFLQNFFVVLHATVGPKDGYVFCVVVLLIGLACIAFRRMNRRRRPSLKPKKFSKD